LFREFGSVLKALSPTLWETNVIMLTHGMRCYSCIYRWIDSGGKGQIAAEGNRDKLRALEADRRECLKTIKLLTANMEINANIKPFDKTEHRISAESSKPQQKGEASHPIETTQATELLTMASSSNTPGDGGRDAEPIRSAVSKVGHQVSVPGVPTLVRSSGVDSHEMRGETLSHMRDEGLLDGIDAEDIDIYQ
jgi:hypothetical protein